MILGQCDFKYFLADERDPLMLADSSRQEEVTIYLNMKMKSC